MECGSEASAHAEADASALQTCPRAAPLSHAVGEGCRGARRCALQRVPPRPLAGEGDKGGEGNKARLPVHAHAGKIAPASATLCRTDVPLSDLKEEGANNELWRRDWHYSLSVRVRVVLGASMMAWGGA